MASKQAKDLHAGDVVRLPQGDRTVTVVHYLGDTVMVGFDNGRASVVPGTAPVEIVHADMTGGAL